MTTTLSISRNLQSLEYTSDITDRATRVAVTCKPLGGEQTFLGNARWKVTANASGVLTLADPAGGTGPVAFNDQFNQTGTYFIYREATAKCYQISDSSASPCTVTITGDPGIAVGEYVQFRTNTFNGTAIPVGPGGRTSTAGRGYILPLVVTGIASNVLTIQNSTFVQGVGSDGLYIGDSVLFSAHVKTDTGSVTMSGTWPNATITITDTTGINVGDWCYNATGSQYLEAFPPFEVVAVVDGTTLSCKVRSTGPIVSLGISSETFHFVRPVSSSTVTASSASAQSLTVASASGWSVASGNGAVELSYVPVLGLEPYYLDHPIYAQVAPTGIGVKFGTIERQDKYTAVSNLCKNALTSNWSGGVPVDYIIQPNSPSLVASDCVTQITDLLYEPLGSTSVKVQNALFFATPVTPWKATFPGQRISIRVKMYISGTFSGDSTAMQYMLRPGYTTGDGNYYLWGWNDPILIIVPPDTTSTAPTWQKQSNGVWFDAVINGFDITAAAGLGGFIGNGGFVEASPATVPNLNGLFFCISGNSSTPPDFYFAGASITVSDIATDDITEFGQANLAWQDANVALQLLAKPQQEIQVEVVDLYRMNPDSTDAVDELTYPGSVRLYAPDLGVQGDIERVVELRRDIEFPGRTTLTLGKRLKRFIDMFVKSQNTVQQTVAAAMKSSNATGLSSGATTSSTGGTSLSLQLAVNIDSATGDTTITSVSSPDATSVKIAYSTSAPPTEADVRATTAITSLPASLAGATLSDGQTLYVAGFAYNAQGTESPLANNSALYTAFTGSQLSSVNVMFSDSVDLGYNSSNNRYDEWSDKFGYSDSLGRGGGGCWTSKPWGGNGYQMYNYTKNAMGFVFSINMNGATVASDGHVLLLTQDGTSFAANFFLYLDSSRHLVAARVDSASDVTLGTSTFALPSTGWGTLEVCVGYANTATGYVTVRYRPAGTSSSTTLALNLNNVQTVKTGGTANCGEVFFGNPGSDTFTVGETNGGSWDILIDDIISYDRTSVASYLDYAGYLRVGATLASTLGTYTDGSGSPKFVNHLDGAMNTGFARLTAATNKRSYKCAAVSNVGSIVSVLPCANFCSTQTADRLKVGIYSGGSLVETTQFQSSGGTIKIYSTYIDSGGCPFRLSSSTDPATSAAWTLTGFSNAEVVADYFSLFTGTNEAYFTQLGFEFVYRPTSNGEGMGAAAGIDTSAGIFAADSFETATNSYGDQYRYSTFIPKYVAGGGIGSTRCNSVDSTTGTQLEINNRNDFGPYYSFNSQIGAAFWINMNAVTLTGDFMMLVAKSGSTDFTSISDKGSFYLAIDTSRNIKAYRVDSGVSNLIGTSTSALPSSAWVHLDIRIHGDSGWVSPPVPKGTVEIWMTDTSGTRTKILDLQNVQTRTTGALASADFVRVMTHNSGNGNGILWKDFVWWNPNQTAQGSGLGNVRVSPLYPNGSGTYQQSIAYNYTKVTDDDIATFNEFNAANVRDSYTLTDPASVTIKAVCPFWVIGSASGSGGTAKLFVRTSGVEHYSATTTGSLPLLAVPLCYITQGHLSRMVMPYDPSGSAWTPTSLTGTEAGVYIKTYGSSDPEISQIGIEYVYQWP